MSNATKQTIRILQIEGIAENKLIMLFILFMKLKQRICIN